MFTSPDAVTTQDLVRPQTKNEKNAVSFIQVCHPSECLSEPMTMILGQDEHDICCPRGFEKSLLEFLDFVGDVPPPPLNYSQR